MKKRPVLTLNLKEDVATALVLIALAAFVVLSTNCSSDESGIGPLGGDAGISASRIAPEPDVDISRTGQVPSPIAATPDAMSACVAACAVHGMLCIDISGRLVCADACDNVLGRCCATLPSTSRASCVETANAGITEPCVSALLNYRAQGFCK